MTSQEFRAIRHQLGLTQAELAEIMGMPISSISRIERGERQPTKIMAAFARYVLKKSGKGSKN
ncbi:MAG: XRE family transcriptional regulator [Bacteroidia bacterium]|nr:XRE family transcriptional regulator [Bacteroidia bacterium]